MLEPGIPDSQKRAKHLESKVGALFEHEKYYHQLAKCQAELKGKLAAFEHNRQNRFISEAKDATIVLAEGNQEQKRDFLKKSVRTYRWRRNPWWWSSKNRGIY